MAGGGGTMQSAGNGTATFTAPGGNMFGGPMGAPKVANGMGKPAGNTMTINAPGGNIFGGTNAAPNTGAPGQNVFTQANQSLGNAIAGTQAAMNYTPGNITAPTVNPAQAGFTGANASNAGIRTAQVDTLVNSNLNRYMNPFEKEVINDTMQGLDFRRKQAMNQLDAQAGAAGAFGGSRHGVAMGVTNGEYADAQASALANLNSANFGQAQQAAMFDNNNRNNMAQFNTGQTNAGRQFNAGLNTQNSQFNAGQQNNMGQFNAGQANGIGQFNAGNNMQAQISNQNAGLAGQNLNLSAAGQMGNLSNLGFGQGMQINGMQNAQGGQQQQLNQQLINAAMQQFGGFTGAPQQSLQQLLGGVGGVPYGTNGTQTTTNNPGLFDYLKLGLGF